jgi:hypothetical protein
MENINALSWLEPGLTRIVVKLEFTSMNLNGENIYGTGEDISDPMQEVRQTEALSNPEWSAPSNLH